MSLANWIRARCRRVATRHGSSIWRDAWTRRSPRGARFGRWSPPRRTPRSRTASCAHRVVILEKRSRHSAMRCGSPIARRCISRRLRTHWPSPASTRRVVRCWASCPRSLSREFVWPMGLAMAHAHLGDTGVALDYLERAYDERVGWMLLAPREPAFDILRDEPRFQALMRKIGPATPLSA